MTLRAQSLPEELANSVSHGAALLAAIAAVPFLMLASSHAGNADDTLRTNFVGALVFALTMVFLYSTSTLYHALPEGRAKAVFLKLDHGAIYFFIAGSYTPFALGAMNGSLDWFMLGLVWAMALAGATLKVINRLETPWLSTGLYLAMGWLVLVAAVPIVERVSLPVFNLLVAGGLAYTVGVVFFVLDAKLRYAHTVWHGFVAAGTGCHYFAVLGYVT
jgi:hemolysin III